MKKILAFAIFILVCGMLWAESPGEAFSGEWRLIPDTIELEDGLLVSSDAVYSFPYLGITGISFPDNGFIVFSIGELEYRAFYEMEVKDFDNSHFICTFKDGEIFILKLVRAGSGWRFLYRIAEDSVLKGQYLEEEPEEGSSDIVEELSGENEPDAEDADSSPVYSLYAGSMERIN